MKELEMVVKFIIYTTTGNCNCFSESDLKCNLEFSIQRHLTILRVEAL